MVDGSVDSAKVRELEEELNGIRSAFKDYIHNTREIETGFGQELGNMHNKLTNTAYANDDLANRLQNMEPVISKLERALGDSKKKLLEESCLRREMEEKLKVAESRHLVMRQEFDSLREENGALREEMDGNRSQWEEFHSRIGSHREMRQSRLGDRSVVTDDARRSDNDTISAANLTKSSIPLDDSYLEVLEELETVTEQLISTQQKLWITEDKLGTAESQIEELKDREKTRLVTEEKLLDAEVRLRELGGNQGKLRLAQARLNQLENQISSDEALHARVRELEKELVVANNHIQYSNEVSGTRLEECKSSAMAVNKELQVKLEEATTQNEMLREQVAHLKQHISGECTRSEATTMMELPVDHDNHDLEGMRRANDKLSQENTLLKTTIIRLKKNSESLSTPNDEIFELKDEIETLHFELTANKDQHRLTLLENDATWRRKLEKARGDTKSEIQAMHMNSEGKDKIVVGLQQQINTLCQERDLLEDKALDLESSKTILERENTDKEHQIRNMEDQILNAQKEKTKLEQTIRSLKHTGQGSMAMIEELKLEQDMIKVEVKAMEVLMDCQNGKPEDDIQPENDLIESVRTLRISLEQSKQRPQKGGELKKVEELREELDLVTQELAASKTAQKKLRRALDFRRGDQRDEIEDIRSNLRLREDQQRNPYARDPEPNDAVRVNGSPWMSNKNNSNAHFPSHYRSDPPTIDSQPKENDFDLRFLVQLLETVEEENRIETIPWLKNYLENKKAGKSGDDVDSEMLLKLITERKNLQEEVTQLKLALSTSETAKNQSEEDLEASRDEISRLQNAIFCLKEAISKMRNEYNKILKEAEEREQQNRSEIAGFATQLNELLKINKELEGSNASKAERIQTLMDEILLIKDSLHAAKDRYEGMANELESAKKMVDDVRKISEQKGREVASVEIRAAMREERENERMKIQTQLGEAHEENVRLRRVIETQSEETSKSLQTLETKLKDTVEKSERWQQATEKANQELNNMVEVEKRLQMDLEALGNELVVTRDELDFANASLTRRRGDLVKLKLSKSFGLLSEGKKEYRDYKDLHDQIQQVISHLTANRDTMYSRKTEGLHLKAQLMDIDMSISKIFREKIMLEEELEYLKRMFDETREAAEKRGRREATREAWSEIREQHENEIRDFKDQFSSLAEENRFLEMQLRKYETTGRDSNDSPRTIEPGNKELKKEVELSNLESKNLSRECLKLRLAMESMKDKHEQVVDELKLRLGRESEGVVIRLQNEVKGLRSEISEMQRIAEESRCKEKEYRREIKRLLNVLANSQDTLERVNEERHQMTEAMEVTKSSTTQIVEKLRSKLLSSSQEIAKLSSKVSDLTLALDERKKDLQLSREENRNNKKVGRQQVHDLHINSSSLHEYTNELEAMLKLSREEVAQTKDELLGFKNRVQCLEKEVKEQLAVLNAAKSELAKERLNSDQTTKVLEAINSRLNSVDGMTSGHELGTTMDTTQMAERLEWRVEKLISVMNDSRMDVRDKLKLQLHAETSEMKFHQAKQEASRLKNEVTRLLKERRSTKNKSPILYYNEDSVSNKTQPKPEMRPTKSKPPPIRYVHDNKQSSTRQPLMKQAFDRKSRIQRVDPESRCSMESDIVSEAVSMKSMESNDYMDDLSSELRKSSEESSRKVSEIVDTRSEADSAVSDVDRYQLEKRHDPPSQSDLLMDHAIYHV